MNKIRTYQDLLQEEQRLVEQLKIQETVIRQDLVGFRENVEPVKKFFTTAQKMFTRDNRVPFFNIGLELAIDILLRRFILRKAGWISRTIVPYLVKNFSSHVIGEEKRRMLVKKVRELFAKIRPKQTQANGMARDFTS
jgi:hypothetical protein